MRARIVRAMSAPLFPHAAVATPHYLAASAGLAVLTSGGNAVDAAVAANLVLAVVYPHMCGLGGDLFAMVWSEGDLVGVSSSGALPAAAKLDGNTVPRTGIGSATVPGAVAGWLALLERFGTRSMSELARPAVRLAREGAPRAPGLACSCSNATMSTRTSTPFPSAVRRAPLSSRSSCTCRIS